MQIRAALPASDVGFSCFNEFSCVVMYLPRGLCRHAVSGCVSICPSITFVDCVKTNKYIFKIFSPSGS